MYDFLSISCNYIYVKLLKNYDSKIDFKCFRNIFSPFLECYLKKVLKKSANNDSQSETLNNFSESNELWTEFLFKLTELKFSLKFFDF